MENSIDEGCFDPSYISFTLWEREVAKFVGAITFDILLIMLETLDRGN